jgi:hypothetical protein
MFPPVCDDAPHSGIDQVSIGAMAIKACIAAKEVIDAMAMIFNRLDQTQLQHNVKTLVEIPVKRSNVALG